jgi:dTDP-4-amino-4,6-dideoxygalactose transaminase
VHGSKPKYHHHFVGGNFRLDPLQAAMLAVKLPHYDRYTANRQANAAFYLGALSQLPGVIQADPSHCKCVTSQDAALAAADAKIVLPVAYPHNTHIWNQFTLRVLGSGQRDALRDHLSQAKIGCEIYYPVTMDQQKCFADTPASSRTGCEVAHRLASEVISIPIYPELSPEQRTEVVAAIAAFLTA